MDLVDRADLERGELTASWRLEAKHPSMSEVEGAAMLKGVLIGMLLTSIDGAWDVSDDWNNLLPGLEFTQLEGFLRSVWGG